MSEKCYEHWVCMRFGREVEAIIRGFWEAQPPNLGPRRSRMPV